MASRGALGWVIAAAVLGCGIGLGAGSSSKVAIAIVLVPALMALLLRPDWLPLLLTATIFVEAVSVGGLSISRLTSPLAILLLVLRFGLGGSPVRFEHKAILLAVGAYLTWTIASVLWSVDLAPTTFSEESGGTAYAISALVLSITYMFAIAVLTDTEQRLKRVVVLIWGMSVVMGVVAITQYHGESARSMGLSGDPNFFAALQVIALPIGVIVATQIASARTRPIVLVGLAIVIGSILTSLSRGGLLALAAVLVLLSIQPARGFFRTRARKSAFITAAAIGAIVLLAFSYSALSARTSSLSSSGSSGSGRAYLWSAALVAFSEHPVLGLGFGAFPSQANDLLRRTPGVNFRQYALRPQGQPVHNTYLESLTELGVIGAVLFVAVLVSMFVTLRTAIREASAQGKHFLAALGRALQLSLLGFAATSIFLSAETHRTLWVLLGLALALTRVLTSKGALPTNPKGSLAGAPSDG